MAEHHAPAHQAVRSMPSDSFKPLKKRLVDSLRAECVDEFVIVYGFRFAVLVYAARYVEWSDDLLF